MCVCVCVCVVCDCFVFDCEDYTFSWKTVETQKRKNHVGKLCIKKLPVDVSNVNRWLIRIYHLWLYTTHTHTNIMKTNIEENGRMGVCSNNKLIDR